MRPECLPKSLSTVTACPDSVFIYAIQASNYAPLTCTHHKLGYDIGPVISGAVVQLQDQIQQKPLKAWTALS